MTKEILYALSITIFILTEIYMLTHIREISNILYYGPSYIRATRRLSGKNITIIVLSAVTMPYWIWIITAIITGTYWYLYLIIGTLSLLSTPIRKYAKRVRRIKLVRRWSAFNAIISLLILIYLFYLHFVL